MERKRSKLTPEDYAKAVISLSRRYTSTSVFPGNNYFDLAEWVLHDRISSSTAKAAAQAELSAQVINHDLVVVYNTKEKKWSAQRYGGQDHEAFSAASASPEDDSGEIVFIRGYVPPAWVCALGSKYHMDPEYFERHMGFLSVSSDRHAYSSPGMATSYNNSFRLCVNTLFYRDPFGSQNLGNQRQSQAAQLAIYKNQQLGSIKMLQGDSMGREYSILCPSYSILEQWISVYITKIDKKWAVIVWMDQGRPLEQSAPGPWSSHIASKAWALPVLQHHPKMAFRTTFNQLDTKVHEAAEVQQAAAILPLQYDSLLALVDLAPRASRDPLSMCIPLFAHAAFSELQFLNLMESKVQREIDTISAGFPADAVGNFQYFSNLLNRHAQHLKNSLRALRRMARQSDQSTSRAKVEVQSTDTQKPLTASGGVAHRQTSDYKRIIVSEPWDYEGTYTANGLIIDHEELVVRCTDLSEMCIRGVTLAMNKAAIDESRKGIEQSERVKRLTVLATIFIPLGFSTSLFGMNLNILGQGDVSVWWFFILCVPIILLTYLLYTWDWQAIRQFYVRLSKRVRRKGDSLNVTNHEKDPTHIV